MCIEKKMKDYPRLTEMGVLHPGQIQSYTVNSIDYIDVLRIVYVRPKGSILPISRTYKFPRVQKSVALTSGASETKIVMESDPCLRVALEELADLMAAKDLKQDAAAAILDELRKLEEDITVRIECIKQQVSKFQAE